MKNTVLITGCSSGFGKAAASLFSDEGWNVVATMRNTKDGQDLAERENIFVTSLDVQDLESIRSAINAGIRKFSKIDLLVNNAGFSLFGVFEEISNEKIIEQFAVNVFGLMETTKAILPHFRENKNGMIINMSSGAGVFTRPLLSVYCASKFAIEGFSEALSYELADQNIIVKLVESGGVGTTNFNKRTRQEAQMNNTLNDYQNYVEKTLGIFKALQSNRVATADDVAKVIFRAATDGSNQLRYVATDDIKPLLSLRRESNEESYLSFMRKRFKIPKP